MNIVKYSAFFHSLKKSSKTHSDFEILFKTILITTEPQTIFSLDIVQSSKNSHHIDSVVLFITFANSFWLINEDKFESFTKFSKNGLIVSIRFSVVSLSDN